MEFFSSVSSLATEWGILLLRIIIGFIFFYHGILKFKMWEMKPSDKMSPSMLTIFRFLSFVEPLGGIAMIAGFLTQLASLGFAIIMIGAINLKAFKMKRSFTGNGGWELDLIILTILVFLFFTGAGHISLDHFIFPG